MPQATGNSNVTPVVHRPGQGGDGVGVVHPLERRLDELLHPADALGVDALGEERHVVAPLVEHGPADVPEARLGQVGVVGQVGEGDLGLDHPELGQVAGGVGVLGPEGRPERVHPAHGQAVGLDVELAGDGEVGLPAEEVLA